MTIIAGIDLETTGIDPKTSSTLEVGFVIKKIGEPRPLAVYSSYVRPTTELLQTKIHGITEEHLVNAMDLCDVLRELDRLTKRFGVEYLAGHNLRAFDIPFLKQTIEGAFGHPETICSSLFALPLLDTKEDIVYPESFTSLRLHHICAELGFINPFPHSALFDVMSTLRVLDHYVKEQPILEQSKIPFIYVRAMVSYDDREKAKERRYRWENVDNRTFAKSWVKKIRENTLAKEKEESPFPISVLS